MNIRAILPFLLAPVLVAQTAENKVSASDLNPDFRTFVKKLGRASHFHGRQSRLMAELGGALLNGGKAAEGEELLQEALKKGKFDPQTRYLVGSAYLRHKQTDKAIEVWNPMLRWGQDSVRTIRQIAIDLLDAGEVADSERYMQRVVALKPDGWLTRATYASLLLGKGHKEASMRWMADAVRNDPNKELASLWMAESLGAESGKAMLPPETRSPRKSNTESGQKPGTAKDAVEGTKTTK